jgi:hypothetical protein
VTLVGEVDIMIFLASAVVQFVVVAKDVLKPSLKAPVKEPINWLNMVPVPVEKSPLW